MKYVEATTSAVIDAFPIETVRDLTETDGIVLLQLPDNRSVPGHLNATSSHAADDFIPQAGDYLIRHSDGSLSLHAKNEFEGQYSKF